MRPPLRVQKPMQLYQDQSPAAVTRIVLASRHDTLSMLDYNIYHIEALSTAGLGGVEALKLSHLQILGFFSRFDLCQEYFYMVVGTGFEPV